MVARYLKRSSSGFSAFVFLVVVALLVMVYTTSFLRGRFPDLSEERESIYEERGNTRQIALHQTNKNPFTRGQKRKQEYERGKTNEWEKRSRLELFCGSGWQDRYARLHNDVTASGGKEKYLAYTCPPGYRKGCFGYGNRLRAVVSLFYLAILTDRAFLIDWQTPEPIQNHLKPKRIQWNHTPRSNLKTRRHYWGTDTVGIRKAQGWIVRDGKHFGNWLKGTDLSSYFDAPIEEVNTIWYFVEGGINRNPYLMRRAKELNITPLISPGLPKFAVIGCAFDFLFEKSRAVDDLLQRWRHEVRRAGGPIIGLHIRTGDKQFDYMALKDDRLNNIQNLTRLNEFFKCARHVEQTVFKFSKSANNALWFLATDNNRVKEYARENFPGKVVTTNLTIQHLDILHNTTILNDTIECNFTTGINGSIFCYNTISFNKTLYCAKRTNHTVINDNSTITNKTHRYTEGIVAMLVEHFLLSECEFLILCDSSFSSTAVGLSMRGRESFVLGDRGCVRYTKARHLRRMRYFRKKRSIK